MSINFNDKKKIESSKSLQLHTLHSAAVVRVYRTRGGNWEYTGIMGVATISTDQSNKCSSIMVLDLIHYNKIFEQELYYDFDYQTARPYFHSFEVEDCVAGFSFADDNDANQFSSSVKQNVPQRVSTQQQQPKAPSRSPPPKAQHNSPSSSHKKDKKKKKSFFGRLFGGKDEEEEHVVEISGPTNFRHESHIGWDPVNGFDIRNIPPAWKKLFKQAGIKKSELKDGATAKFVMETIVENLSAPAAPPPPSNNNAPPPAVPRRAPPPPTRSVAPPPPTRNVAPPPPPNRSVAPPPPNRSVAPPPPPPSVAPPPPSNAPPPPSAAPPPIATRAPPPSSSLADMIKQKKLKHVEVSEKDNLPQLPENTGTLAGALAQAMKNRRGAMVEDEVDSDEVVSDDEWSD